MATSVATGVVFPSPDTVLLDYVEAYSGQRVLRCMQCGKCTAGCPVAPAMDLTPRQVIRSVQLGLADEVLKSDAIRLCVSCYTCAVRCPAEIDIPRVMDALVQRAAGCGIGPPRHDVPLFQRLFLKMVELGGRPYELGLASLFNLLSGRLFANVSLLPALLQRGKLPLLPPSAGSGEVQRIFARVAAHRGDEVLLPGGPVALVLPGCEEIRTSVTLAAKVLALGEFFTALPRKLRGAQ